MLEPARAMPRRAPLQHAPRPWLQGPTHSLCSALLHPQVRLSQLDKEGAELRDENAQLHARLVGLQEAAVADWQAQVQGVAAGRVAAGRVQGCRAQRTAPTPWHMHAAPRPRQPRPS